MKSKIFNENFFNISGKILDLRLIDVFVPDNGDLPFYWWNIVLKSENAVIGKISLRLGSNFHSYYNGNIGYEIDKEYPGHHYSFFACQMILPIAKQHNLKKLYITCDYDNIPSYKTIEKLGGKLVEEVVPPVEYLYYFDGIAKHKIYQLELS